MRLPFGWRKRDADLDEEIQSHLRMAAQARAERGEDPQQAEQLARAEFGNVGLIKETTRGMWRGALLDQARQDLRYGLRMLRRSPGFTAIAALSLALGIGANSAVFTVINALMLRQLPVPHPEQLVDFGWAGDGVIEWPYATFEKFRQLDRVFSGVSAISEVDRSNINVQGPGGGLDASTVRVALVSGTYFSTLGIRAAAGRLLTGDDDRVPGGHPVAVISYDYWRRRFAQSPSVVGRTFALTGTTYAVLGVTQPSFTGDWVGMPVDIWIPIAMQSQVMLERPGLLDNPNPPWVRIVARLRPGVAVAQAVAAAKIVYPQAVRERRNLTPQMIEEELKAAITLESGARGFSWHRFLLRQPLTILMATTTLVLLIACVNIATMLLARSAARQREMAVRVSLGAGRAQILRQLLTESVLLALLGGLLGILFAIWGTDALSKFWAGSETAMHLDLGPDRMMLAFAAALCLLTGLLFGLAPALRSSKSSPLAAMAGRGVIDLGHSGRFGFGKSLVIVQVALSLVLLIGAGLFVRTLRNLQSQDVGFDRQHVLLVWTAPDRAGRQGASVASLFEIVGERLAAIPGVRSVSPSAFGLLGGLGRSPVTNVEGYTRRPGGDFYAYWSLIGPEYFETVGIRRLLGRGFTARDNETAPRVAIINESMARYYFGDQNPVGKHFGIRRDTGTPIEIVGVVQDSKYVDLRDKNAKMMYIPYRQDLAHLYDMCVAVRAAGNAKNLPKLIADATRDVDPNLPILKIDTAEEQLNGSLSEERLIAVLSSFFAVLAVMLACLGLYGAISYTTARRTNEIGIRLALGAHRMEVLAMVLRESLWLVAAGIAIGVPLTLAMTRFIAARLFGVSPTDPITIAAATTLLFVVAAGATFLPARRASKVDPMVALRYE